MVRSQGMSSQTCCNYMARIAKCPAPAGGCFCGLPLQYEGPLGSVECVHVFMGWEWIT